MLDQNIKQEQAGFSLVELLVGMTISLFVAGVAIGYLISSGRSLTEQTNSDFTQENARFAFQILSANMRLAGLNTSANPNSQVAGVYTGTICDASVDKAPEEPAVSVTPCIEDTTPVYQAYARDDKGILVASTTPDSDRVAVDFVTDSFVTCTGSQISSEQSIVTVFWVADVDADGVSSLYCQAYASPFNLVTKAYDAYQLSGTVTPLVDGIDSMQVQYGVDSDDDGDIETYSAFANIDPANLDKIRAIRVGLLIGSGQTVPSAQSTEKREARTYQVLDGEYESLDTDGQLRKTASTTIFLPNLILSN